MTSIAWNAEGGSDGTATSTANSGGGSGTAWDTCQRGTNATNEYDSATAANGSLSVLIATGVTSTTAYNRWNGALTALWASGLTTHYGRLYFRLAGLPATNRVICEFLDTTAATNRANIQVLTTGAVRLRNAANGTVATTSTTISINTWYRLEYRIDGTTTGAYELHLYAGNGGTALEDIVGGTANFGGAIGAAGYGYVSNGANLASLWFDSIQINDAGLPGTESLSGVAPDGIAVAATLGSPTVSIPSVALDGIAVAVALGSPTTSIPSVAPDGIAVSATLGSPTVSIPSVAPAGIAVTAALGAPATSILSAGPDGITVPAALGQPTATIPSAAPDGIAVTATLGAPSVTIPTAAPDGVAVAALLGQPAVQVGLSAAPSGIAIPVALGAPTAGPTVAQRDLQVVVGPPTTKWRTGPPGIKWRTERPVLKWRTGSPRT